MHSIITAAVIATTLALGSGAADAASRSERRAAALAAAVPAGKAESCIPINQIRNTRVRSDGVIDFFMRGRKVYRNTLPSSCPQLGFDEAFSYSTSLSQLCSSDIITVLHTGGGLSRGASCGLGEFQPVTGVKD
jgi:hypothetical protein